MDAMLTIRLDETHTRLLEEEAKRTNRSKSAIVRQALEEHLTKQRPNARDGLADYVGIVSGPSDLSTNRKYLQGLGRRRP